MTEDSDRLAHLIEHSHRILIVTGAGASTGSGIPDYRGPNGVWKTRRPIEFSDFLASEPRRTEYWEQRLASRTVLERAVPGPVHAACVDLEANGRIEAVVTQNVDGLHRRAGSSDDVLIEIHGTAVESGCLECGERTSTTSLLDEFTQTRIPPRCPSDGGLMKPATISFGQPIDSLTLVRAWQAADRCDLVIALGSTLSVYPAAEVPLRAASTGSPYAIVNRGATDHDGHPFVSLRIEADVDVAFPEAVGMALERTPR